LQPVTGEIRSRGRRDALGFLVVALRERPWARRALSVLSIVLLLVGVGLLAYPFVTNLYQGRVQARLDRQLASPELRQAYRERRVETGDSLTRLKIPAIKVDVVVVEGISPKALRAGAGHYPATPLPCETGNVGIAGHRTTYGKPFANLDRLKVGDVLVLETPIGSCTYELRRVPFVTMPTDLSVVAPRADRRLTLTTCHPRGSAAKRLIVQAQLVREEPLARTAG
jgi:sortase A